MVAPAALVGPKGLATTFANVVMGRLERELEKKYQMWKNIERESKSLKSALILLASAVDDQEKVASHTAVARVYGDEIRELTHDIEDCIERFLLRIACRAGVSRARRSAHAITTFRTRLRFGAKIKELKNRVSEARERVLNAAAAAGGGAQPTNEGLQGVEYVQNFTPVGIAEATQEVLTLLDVEPYQDEAEVSSTPEATPLRVVALLGFGGSGKTTLARAVHDRVRDQGKIPCAWFSGHSLDMDANGIVKHILAKTSRAGCHDDKENSSTKPHGRTPSSPLSICWGRRCSLSSGGEQTWRPRSLPPFLTILLSNPSPMRSCHVAPHELPPILLLHGPASARVTAAAATAISNPAPADWLDSGHNSNGDVERNRYVVTLKFYSLLGEMSSYGRGN